MENKVKEEQVIKPDYSNSSKSRKPEHGKTRKPGSIFCVCSIQTYENGMLLCKTCDRFSHAECYRTDDLAKEHICGGCAFKTGVNCSNPEIQNFLSMQDQTQEGKTKFVFDLAVRRVLNSILREEFKLTQPGIEPSVSFLKIKFGISSSYANKSSFTSLNPGS